jgi:hypothetical protein
MENMILASKTSNSPILAPFYHFLPSKNKALGGGVVPTWEEE